MIMSNMVDFVCAMCRELSYPEQQKEQYDYTTKSKKTIDMDAFIRSRKFDEPSKQPLKCLKCNLVSYCSEQCMDDHFRSIHEKECEFFSKVKNLMDHTPDIGLLEYDWDPETERNLLRHLLRILVKRYDEKSVGSQRGGDNGHGLSYHDVLNLIFKTKPSEEHLRISAEAKEILPLRYHPDDPMEMVNVLSRIDCNKFGLFGNKGEIIGSSLHPSASFVNHSCLPNAFSFIKGPILKLFALYPVDPGEELNIGYIEPSLQVKERRASIKDIYGFDCVCKRCCSESGKKAIPKIAYEQFYTKYLCCPSCKKGLLVIADQDDIRSHTDQPSSSSSDSTPENDAPNRNLEIIVGVTELRICNGCRKLQKVNCVPSIAQFREEYLATRNHKVSK